MPVRLKSTAARIQIVTSKKIPSPPPTTIPAMNPGQLSSPPNGTAASFAARQPRDRETRMAPNCMPPRAKPARQPRQICQSRKRRAARKPPPAKLATRSALSLLWQAILRALAQGVIAENERRHRLDHGHRARKHARIVPTAGGELRVCASRGHRLLRLGNRGGGLESDPKNHGLAIADSPLDPP